LKFVVCNSKTKLYLTFPPWKQNATMAGLYLPGRPVRSWLPASVVIDYNAPATLKGYAQGSDKGYNDTRPYTETVYELSTADRVMMQYGPGAAWYSAHPVSDEYTGNPVATQYTTNTASGVQSCKVYGVSGNSLTGGSTYHTAGTLHVVKTTDEDGRVSYTFTTGDGLTLLERRMNGTEQLDTYYVYDSLGRLRFVLQPMYQSTASTDQYAFEFRYNEKGLCTYRKNPGAQYVTYEYDWKDRLAYTQDGVQRSAGKWTFYTYDGVGRPSSQGENTSKASSTSGEYLKNYYDNYNFVGGTGFTSSLYTRDTSLSGWGKLTGQVISVLGGSTKIYVAYYYDAKGRVVRKVESNLLGGHEVTETTYTFTGNPLEVTHTHTASGKTTRTEKYTYVYDAAERVSSVKHKLGSTEVTLASYTYDKHGRTAIRSPHGSSTNGQTYSYNVRSWLTGISGTKFTQTLGYSGLYGGDIKTMSWTANGSSHSYTFGYDGVGRLINANHGAGTYTELVNGYDKNGNIKFLKRTCGSGSLADDLTYTYSGNRITKVEDAAGSSGLFSNGSTATTEYTYDNNGNLKSDLNKGISNITYNCLNLPSVVTFSNGNTITYTYASDGRKLRTAHKIGGTTTTTDYAGNVIYENGVQKKLLTEEGYVDLTSGTYYYYLKDHQGNNRVVVNGSGAVAETNHYYPFGGTFASGTVQPYKYNGKELDTKAGLNWYDYGARHYDAALGRFLTVDPLAEKYYGASPFAYCNNNPIRFIDPDGKDGWDIVVGYGIGFVTNVIPGTGFLRDTYTPTDASDYNNALRGMDNASMVVGAAMIVDGGINITTGGTVATAGIAVTASSAGTGVVVGAPVAAGGATIAGIGTIEIGAGTLLMSNAETNKSAGYERGKKSNVSSGNKNSQHANQKAKSSAEQKYQEAKKKFDELDKKPNKSPEDKKEFNYWERQMKHWKMKQDFSGENHSRNAKGNR